MKAHFFRRIGWMAAALVAGVATAQAQRRPHIGYAYPAGGQLGTTFQVKLGGQDLDDVTSVRVTGGGVTVRGVEVLRRLNNQEIQLLNEQLRILKRSTSAAARPAAPVALTPEDEARLLVGKIERRVREWVQTPACASIASIVNLEVTVAPEAALGPRELRLVSPRGVSNALTFIVGQYPEHSRRPMLTATIQILGKEANALRKRPVDEVEDRIALPCTLNGQIASGEVNRYRFEATKGQRLVFSTQARQLIPFVADAVPGWFQPVVVVYDAQGRELAYADDYRFKPDPVIVFEVPQDGEYVCEIKDSLYRGREDFVYRLTVGELPFVTSVFPLGGQAGAARLPAVQGVNLIDADLTPAWNGRVPGIWPLAASRHGYESNRVPFALDRLRDEFEQEENSTAAQRVELPAIINGRIDRPDDWDIYEFAGQAGQWIVAEVQARRLDSPSTLR